MPDFFHTMTCNPKSRKRSDMNSRMAPCSRRTPTCAPDIIARDFKEKSEQLIKLIMKDQVFGKIAAYFATIEF
jgi:hypothetical protein